MEGCVSEQNERMVIFPVSGGIFGVGRLATRLTELAASHQIGEWHIGHWVDWKHTAIHMWTAPGLQVRRAFFGSDRIACIHMSGLLDAVGI
jgi:hypothetical protein